MAFAALDSCFRRNNSFVVVVVLSDPSVMVYQVIAFMLSVLHEHVLADFVELSGFGTVYFGVVFCTAAFFELA